MVMNEKEFDDIVNELFGDVDSIEETWHTGGQSGASCWDAGPHTFYATSGEKEPDFSELTEILEKVCPAVTYLQFRKLEERISYKDTGDSDYYGNTSNYTTKKLTMTDLWDFLVKYGYGK